MDERQKLNAGNAAMILLFLVGLGSFGYVAWDFLAHKEITNTPVMVAMLVGWGLFYLFYQIIGGEAPKSLLGKDLPTSASRTDRAARRRSYALDAALLAAGMSALTVGALAMGVPDAMDRIPGMPSGIAALIITAIVEFVITAAIFYLIDRWLGESAARAHERRLDRLESA